MPADADVTGSPAAAAAAAAGTFSAGWGGGMYRGGCLVAIGTGATVDASLLLPLSRWGAVADPTLLPIGALLLPSNRLLLLLFGFGRVRAGGGGNPRALRLGLLRVSSAAAVAAAAALRAVVMGAARFRASIPSCNSCLAR